MRTILREGKGSSVEIGRRKERKSREVEVEKYTNRRLVIGKTYYIYTYSIVVVSTFLYTPYFPVLSHLPVTVTVMMATACCWKEAFTAAMAVD